MRKVSNHHTKRSYEALLGERKRKERKVWEPVFPCSVGCIGERERGMRDEEEGDWSESRGTPAPHDRVEKEPQKSQSMFQAAYFSSL